MIKRIFLLIFCAFFVVAPFHTYAQELIDETIPPESEATSSAVENRSETLFEAKVVKILEEKTIQRQDGSPAVQQNLILRGLEGEWEGKEVRFNGISEVDVLTSIRYKIGDKVLVAHAQGPDGEDDFYIAEYVRSWHIYILAFLFALIVTLIGKGKGLKALLSLVLSFVIILKFIIPAILSGYSPLAVSLLGSFLILGVIVYLTEGLNRKSNLAILSIFISLSLTLILSWIFTNSMKLTGMAQEESMFLIGIGQKAIDFRGLLLAGILIGAVGVLDDIIIGQIEAVQQIKEANSKLTFAQTFKMAYKVGNTHLGAIVNTLFLTYTGASLPLLILFSVHQEPFIKFSQIINNELIATEIARTLIGGIGIALSLPIATYFAVKYLKADPVIKKVD